MKDLSALLALPRQPETAALVALAEAAAELQSAVATISSVQAPDVSGLTTRLNLIEQEIKTIRFAMSGGTDGAAPAPAQGAAQ